MKKSTKPKPVRKFRPGYSVLLVELDDTKRVRRRRTKEAAEDLAFGYNGAAMADKSRSRAVVIENDVL